MEPKFSIAIPVHNRAAYLHQAISSCLTQTVNDFEVIVADDCSSEDLFAVVQTFQDPRIQYHRADNRLGAAANHQRSVSLCNGRYVINLHSDDMLLPSCLEIAGEEMDRRPAAAAAYFACTYLVAGHVTGSSLVPAVHFADLATLQAHPWLHRFPGAAPSCCLFRKAAFDQVGGYSTSLRLAYDWELYVRFLTSGGGVIFLPRILSVYRRHGEQSIETNSIGGLWDMLDLLPEENDRNWSARLLMGLILTQFGIKLRSPEGMSGILAIVDEIHRRRLILRLIPSLPAALWDKVRYRIGLGRTGDKVHYMRPSGRDAAIEQANRILNGHSAPRCQ